AEMLLEQAEKDPALREVLHLFGLELNWANLYKMVEAVEMPFGGERGLIKMGWISKGELKRFKHTADNRKATGDDARHGPNNYDPPADPMSLEEAKAMVRKLVAAFASNRPKP
ncbi:MAG: hypothetical protein ACRED3_15345, partial [Bradyrhizobium sp.]